MKLFFKLSLMLLAFLLPATASAFDFEVDGIYYNINGNEAEVTYESQFGSYLGDVIIPATVTYNGTTFPVTSIGEGAFRGCGSLTTIEIPNSVTIIGNYAFAWCFILTTIDIPNSVTIIGELAFCECHDLSSVDISNSVITIGEGAFSGCSSLTSIDIPNSVTFIGNNAFAYSKLSHIAVASGNQYYDSRNNCNAIIETPSNTLIAGCKNTLIPNSVTSIGDFAFAGCSGLTSVIIPNSVTSIGSGAFASCSGLTSVIIPNSVTSIGSYAFNGCSGLTSVSISNSVTSIGSHAFEDCISLTSVTIPSSVTIIGENAFYNCYSLTSIDIPNSVSTIGNYAFYGCSSLNDVYSYISDPSVITMGSFVFYHNSNNYYSRTLHVPFGSVAVYQVDTKWSRYFGSIVEIDTILATSISLNNTSASVTEGYTLQLTATVLPEETTNTTVTWTSSDDAIAAVDATGLVTAVAPGTATITVTTTDGSNLSASCNVTVLQGIVQAESIKLNVTTAGLNEGATLHLTATVLPEECNNKAVLWASNNPSVATVDNNGLVTTHGIGTATIMAITTDGSNLSTTCTVTLLPVGVKGDVNGDNKISISDVSTLIDYLLSGSWPEP